MKITISEMANPSNGASRAAKVAKAMTNLHGALMAEGWNDAAAKEAVLSFFKGTAENS